MEPFSESVVSHDFLLVVVNYNQVHEIDNFLRELLNYWPKERLVVVDDGSTDGSPEKAKQLNLRTIIHATNLGVGAAIRTGISYAESNGYKGIVLMSSNGKMKPSEITSIVTPILDNRADYVTGSRYLEGGSSPGLPPWRRLTIPLFSLFASMLLSRKCTDITCGFRAYKLSFLHSPLLNISQSWLNTYEMEYYIHFWAHKLNLRIVEVPVTIKYSHLDKKRYSKIRLKHYWAILAPLVLLRLGLRR